MFKVLDLFSGIGGFSLGLERTGGFETVAFCEIEPYCQKILKKHWPKVPCYEDIRTLTAEQLRRDGIRPDIITGGFPCQDISTAGKQAGITGERSGLWSELCRLIGELRPRYAILENVSALISGNHGQWFGKILGDLAEVGFDAEWHCIPASAIGAPHRRDRVWIIAYSDSGSGRIQSIRQPKCGDTPKSEHDGSAEFVAYGNSYGESAIPIDAIQILKANLADAYSIGLQIGEDERRTNQKETSGKQTRREAIRENKPYDASDSASLRCGQMEQPNFGRAIRERASSQVMPRIGSGWDIEPDVGRVANGIPARVDRLRGLGNSVVPQIPELIGKAILEYENART